MKSTKTRAGVSAEERGQEAWLTELWQARQSNHDLQRPLLLTWSNPNPNPLSIRPV